MSQHEGAPLVLLSSTRELGKRWCADNMAALGWPPRKVRIVTRADQLRGLRECQIVRGYGLLDPELHSQAAVLVAAGSRWAEVRTDGCLWERQS